METYILIIAVAGLLNFAAFIWLVITGFKRSVLWGLLIFFLSPLAALIFAILNWFEAKKPFLAYLLTTILMIVPMVMMMSQYDEKFVMTLNEKIESGEIKQEQVLEYILNPELLYEEEAETVTQEMTDSPLDESGQPLAETGTGEIAVEKDSSTSKNNDEANTASPAAEAEPEAIVEQEPSPYPRAGEAKPDPLVVKRKAAPKDSVQVSLTKISNYKGRYFIVTTKSGTEHRGILVKITKTQIVLERKIYGGTFSHKVLKKNIKRLDMLKKEFVEDLS